MGEKRYWEDEQKFVEKITACEDRGARAVLARSFGIPVAKAGLEVLVEYLKVAGGMPEYWCPSLEAKFFVTCLACRYGIEENGEIPAERKLHSMYAGDSFVSESIRNEIETLLTMKLDDRGVVTGKLSRLFEIGKDNLQGINLAKLICDLTRWNSGKGMSGTRGRWARAIIYGEDRHGEENQAVCSA